LRSLVDHEFETLLESSPGDMPSLHPVTSHCPPITFIL
jgi:hypothetical protein